MNFNTIENPIFIESSDDEMANVIGISDDEDMLISDSEEEHLFIETQDLFPNMSRLPRTIYYRKANNEWCPECYGKIVDSGPQQLHSRSINELCIGCFRLHECAEDSKELSEIRRWLMNGDLPTTDFYTRKVNSNDRVRLDIRLNLMKGRLSRLSKLDGWHERFNANDLPSLKELEKLNDRSGSRCAFTGYYCGWCRPNQQMFWGLSFDHIIPLSRARAFKMNPWGIQNLQVVSHLMNQIKGNSFDFEVQNWLGTWKRGQLLGGEECLNKL